MTRYELIWSVIRKIPRGRVATYGQIAELAGLEGHARQVGYALHNLPEQSNVPWHRVINSRGEVSPRSGGDSHELQRMLLESEGVAFDLRGRVELKRFRWKPKGMAMRTIITAIFLVSFTVFAAAEEKPCPPQYAYCGFAGPAHWNEVPVADNECGFNMQSPVRITGWKREVGPLIAVTYAEAEADVINTGHDIEVEPHGKAGRIKIGDKEFDLKDFHFHSPVEHPIQGQNGNVVELHLVHYATVGNDIAVIAVMMKIGKSNEVLGPVFQAMPTRLCDRTSKPIKLALQKLLSTEIKTYFTYRGSLTTPPCSERVNFYIPTSHLTLSQQEYEGLAALGENARPTQDRNRRDILLVVPGR